MHEKRIKEGMKPKSYRDFTINNKNLTPLQEKERKANIDFKIYRTKPRGV